LSRSPALCNSKRPSVARVGFIDTRAQAEVPSALRADTPPLDFERKYSDSSYSVSPASDRVSQFRDTADGPYLEAGS
jgi:hypothetical protein